MYFDQSNLRGTAVLRFQLKVCIYFSMGLYRCCGIRDGGILLLLGGGGGAGFDNYIFFSSGERVFVYQIELFTFTYGYK